MTTDDFSEQGLEIYRDLPDFSDDDADSAVIVEGSMVALLDIEQKSLWYDDILCCCQPPASPYGHGPLQLTGEMPPFLKHRLCGKTEVDEWQELKDVMNPHLRAAGKGKHMAVSICLIAVVLACWICVCWLWIANKESADPPRANNAQIKSACKIGLAFCVQWLLVGIFLGTCWTPRMYKAQLLKAAEAAESKFEGFRFWPVYVHPSAKADSNGQKAKGNARMKWFMGFADSIEIDRKMIQDKAEALHPMNDEDPKYIHIAHSELWA